MNHEAPVTGGVEKPRAAVSHKQKRAKSLGRVGPEKERRATRTAGHEDLVAGRGRDHRQRRQRRRGHSGRWRRGGRRAGHGVATLLWRRAGRRRRHLRSLLQLLRRGGGREQKREEEGARRRLQALASDPEGVVWGRRHAGARGLQGCACAARGRASVRRRGRRWRERGGSSARPFRGVSPPLARSHLRPRPSPPVPVASAFHAISPSAGSLKQRGPCAQDGQATTSAVAIPEMTAGTPQRRSPSRRRHRGWPQHSRMGRAGAAATGAARRAKG